MIERSLQRSIVNEKQYHLCMCVIPIYNKTVGVYPTVLLCITSQINCCECSLECGKVSRGCSFIHCCTAHPKMDKKFTYSRWLIYTKHYKVSEQTHFKYTTLIFE